MIESIYNYKQLSPNFATGGQPDASQLRDLAEAGYEVVINLGLADADYSIADEREIVEQKGMQYFHIPVNFEAPEIEKYFEFSQLLKSMTVKKVFIHCAANKRVSVFMAIFNIMEQKMSFKDAYDEITTIWEPNEVWSAYLNDVTVERLK